MLEEVVLEQWMFQPNACIEVENDNPNNQFQRGGKIRSHPQLSVQIKQF